MAARAACPRGWTSYRPAGPPPSAVDAQPDTPADQVPSLFLRVRVPGRVLPLRMRNSVSSVAVTVRQSLALDPWQGGLVPRWFAFRIMAHQTIVRVLNWARAGSAVDLAA